MGSKLFFKFYRALFFNFDENIWSIPTNEPTLSYVSFDHDEWLTTTNKNTSLTFSILIKLKYYHPDFHFAS